MTDEQTGWTRFAQSAVAIVGAGVAGAMSGLLGDPVAGAVAGESFAQIGNELARRALSPRQEERVGAVLVMAAGGVMANQALGMELRTDGFFDGERSDADEVVEGVLIAAKDEHQERKLPYYANLLARMPFLQGMDVYVLNELIGAAESMSWLDMQLLSIVGRPEELGLPDADYVGTAENWNDWAVTEAFTTMLNGSRLIIFPREKSAEGPRIPRFDLRMSSIQRGRLGLLLYDFMELDKIPVMELKPIYDALVRGASADAHR
ncbi:hypothetical protein [Leifsonia sp. SIMBA_070]|uniref:hypothetical protein n=1 Tax=Leifsonia sp. SIMBA_070 TaxID=3085810 RepID=UPI003978B039